MILTPKILIVDDEPRMCESLKLLLSTQGYEIETANSGKEAMTLLAQEEFDLALLDIVIPDVDGHHLMEHIKGSCPETFVIVITGHASLDSAVNALRKGAYDYLRKPFEYEELLKTVQNALDQKKLKSEKEIINGKLELSEERYRYLVQNSPDIIYTLDDQGNFTFVSEAVERLLGYQSKDLVGQHYSKIIYEKDLQKAERFFGEVESDERTTSGTELRLKHARHEEGFRDCEIRHITIELKSPDRSDKPFLKGERSRLGIHGVARDISDRKRLEAQLQHAQKIEAVGTLAGGIAHDFNNLLMGIQGYTSLMLLRTDPTDPNYDKLKSIEQYVQSGAELTRQLLGFARGGKYDVRPIDLNEVIKKTAQMFGRTKKEILIKQSHQEDIWSVEADQGQIEQVLLNLYVNAWQAMPGGGEMTLSTENVMLEAPDLRHLDLEAGPYVRICVADTGVGMDETTRQRIFEPFFTTKKMGRGTGLGLASAYGIIKNHGGVIEVRSEKGKGTTFMIYLPASGRDVEREKDRTQEIFRGPETILLVDDEEMIIDVGSEVLETLGYRVLTARSGREAVNVYKENKDHIDVVVLDMIMPGMSGGETYDSLKEIDPKVKVLLSSGYSVKGEATEILKRGCDGFIQKPFDIRTLSQKLRDLLEGRGAEG